MSFKASTTNISRPVTLPAVAPKYTGEREERWANLLRMAVSGDAIAYESFLTSITPYVRAIVKVKITNPADAEDIVQEALLGVHRARHTFQSDRPITPWLHGIVRYKIIDCLRKTKRHYEDFSEADFADGAQPFSDTLALRSELAAATETLSLEQQQLVRMSGVEDQDLQSLAAQTGLASGTVKVRLHRAYKALKEQISKGRAREN